MTNDLDWRTRLLIWWRIRVVCLWWTWSDRRARRRARPLGYHRIGWR